MYDANASYEENYARGPQPKLNGSGKLPIVTFLEPARFKVWNVPLQIPFGIPAGPLLNSSYVIAALKAGFCVPTYKTVRSGSWKSHGAPNIVCVLDRVCESGQLEVQKPNSFSNIFPNDDKGESSAHLGSRIGRPMTATDYLRPHKLSITNSFGVPSQSSALWTQDFAEIQQEPFTQGQTLVCLSFQGSRSGQSHSDIETLIEDSVQTALLARKALNCYESPSASAFLEINLSCPNEKGAPLFSDVLGCAKLLSAVQEALLETEKQTGSGHVYLVAKIGYMSAKTTLNWLSENHMFVDGVSAINTIPAEIESPQGKVILGVGQKHAGVCGEVIKPYGLKMIKHLADARIQLKLLPRHFALFGVGGAMTAADLCDYLDAGADVVQAATGAMWNLELASEVASRLGVAHRLSY
jgi:dihydroorotate dehydrogenase (NAD+) catalytic subunit